MKRNKHEAIFVAALAIIFGGMSIGFAAYQQNLTVTGQTTVAANKWDVHFDENSITYAQYQNGVNLQDATPGPGKPLESATLSPDKQSINLEINLKHPEDRDKNQSTGDLASVSISIVNTGTFNAKFTDFQITGIPDTAKDYLYIMSYLADGQPDAQAGQPQLAFAYEPGKNDLIIKKPFILKPLSQNPQNKAGILFGISYVQPTDPNKLPKEDVNFTITLSYKAEQA